MSKKKGNRKHLYTSKGAHLAVMSELLCLGWNVAIPEVDVGDDIFVVSDKPVTGTNRQFFAVQVKYSMAAPKAKGNYSAAFDIPFLQLETTPSTLNDLIYVLVPRFNNKWASFFVIDRFSLFSHHIDTTNPVGNKYYNKKSKKDFLRLNMYYDVTKNTVEVSGVDLSKYLNARDLTTKIKSP